MSFSKLATIANAGHSVATALSALSTASESVPESSPAYTGGAASAIGLHPPVTPAPFPASPFYTPPVQVSDTEIKKEAEIRSAFLLAKLRFGSSVVRNLVAEIIVKASDEETLQHWESQQLSTPPSGSAAAKALKRIGIKNKLKDFKSPMTDEDGELVELLKEALFLDLKEQAQRGQFRKMGYDEMLTKLISIEFMGLGESLTGPLTELFKETLSKNPS